MRCRWPTGGRQAWPRVVLGSPEVPVAGTGSTVGCVDTTPAPDLGDGDFQDVRGPEDADGLDMVELEGAEGVEGVEGVEVAVAVEPGGDPLRFSNWMQRSTTGAILSGIALGLHHALEPKRQQPAFVMEAPGEPEDPDAPITLHFDPDDPTKTVAVIRAPSAPASRDSGDG